MALTEHEIDAVLACYRKGWLTLGPRTRELEEALGRLFGCHARAVTGATAALHLAFRAIGLRAGDEVLLVGCTGPVARGVTAFCGATPVVAPGSRPTAELEPLITTRTRAVIAEHRGAGRAERDALRGLCDRHELTLIEEVTEALGVEASGVGEPSGLVGDLAYLSFGAPSPLDLGTGGAVLTASEDHAAVVASLRSHAMTSGTWERHHGREETYDIVDLGYNHRFDEPRAVLALTRLTRLAGRPVTADPPGDHDRTAVSP